MHSHEDLAQPKIKKIKVHWERDNLSHIRLAKIKKDIGYGEAGPLMYYSVQFSSVAQSCLTLCDPMNRSTPGLPVHHQLPEFTQTHVHRVGDAIQPSHPLLSPSPPAPNPFQHQGLLQWVNSSHVLLVGMKISTLLLEGNLIVSNKTT